MGVLTIVGAGPGLGAELASLFGAKGYRVGLIARDPDMLASMREDLRASGTEAIAAVADVAEAAELIGALDSVSALLGEPDVVISNTSMMVEAPPTQVSLEVFETTWRVACLSTLIALQQVAPPMVERGAGTFLVPGTSLALRPWAPGVSLGAAKSAARNLIMCAHDELKPANVHVSMITVNGMIKAGTKFDPKAIAEQFWDAAAQLDSTTWRPELVFDG